MVSSRKPDLLPRITELQTTRICSTTANVTESQTRTFSDSTGPIPVSSGFKPTPFTFEEENQERHTSDNFERVVHKEPTAEESFVAATLAALEEGSITPLVKEELKYTIQSRRLAEGKGTLHVEFSEPEPMQLTDDEKSRVVKRREQNRNAARRFRSKQKQTASSLLKETQRLESSNTLLRAEMRKLSKERDALRAKLNNHLCVCSQVAAFGPIGRYLPT